MISTLKRKRARGESPPSVAFTNGQIILPDRVLANGTVVCENGIITRVSSRSVRLRQGIEVIDLKHGYLAPGFIDIHVHGGNGYDFMDGNTEAILGACQAHCRHGTTTIFPTTTTGPSDQIHAMLQAVNNAKATVSHAMPRIPGVHLYGPFFAPEKSGCHRQDECRSPTPDEVASYFETKLIRIATCAAELDGAIEFYKLASKHRCLVTCGHSNASWPEMASAHQAGMSHVDHFWCAMSTVASVRSRLGTPMHGSMLEFVLGHSTMSTEVIADGSHLAPELLEFAWRMKSSRMLCLVTDSNRAMDMPPGPYVFGHHQTGPKIYHDGLVGRTAEGGLASAVQGMDHNVRHMAKNTNVPLHEVVRMASLTPAERTGISRYVGSIEVGKVADLLVFDNDLILQSVFIDGQSTTL